MNHRSISSLLTDDDNPQPPPPGPVSAQRSAPATPSGLRAQQQQQQQSQPQSGQPAVLSLQQGGAPSPRPPSRGQALAVAERDRLIHLGSATYPPPPTGNSMTDSIIREFHDALSRAPEVAVAVAAIKALTSVISRSTAQTMMGLEKEVKDAAASMQRYSPTAISLKAACELFLRYVTRTTALESDDFAVAKARLIERGNLFAETSTQARQTIADLGARFIRNGATVLIHGYSRVVLTLLRRAVAQGLQFSVVLTEGRPDETGLLMARALEDLRVPLTAILDSAVAYYLERVDMVLVGAEGVVENGGVINKLGTYQVAIAARHHNIPFYVAAESYKFARLYPLNQRDLPVEPKHVDFGPLMPRAASIENPSRDYTPPSFISLLFTDLGVLTPAAVSDELIQLYV